MSIIPTPAQAAADRRAKLIRESAVADLKQRCLEAIQNYDGNKCATLPMFGDDRQYIPAVEAQMPGWSLYASSTDETLYLGEAAQTALLRTRDSLSTGSGSIELSAFNAALNKPWTHSAQTHSEVVAAAARPTTPSLPNEPVSQTFGIARVERSNKKLPTTRTTAVLAKTIHAH